MPTDRIQREGDYEAARTHADATREFAEAGEVQKAPSDAAPKHEAEAEAHETKRTERQDRASGNSEIPGETSPTTIAQPPKGN